MNRLTSAQFKACIKGKRWKIKELAEYWQISHVWLSKLISDPERPPYYDGAVMDLPLKHELKRHLKRREQTANRYLGRFPEKQRKASGLRYQGILMVGTVISVIENLGSIAEEGMRGVVFQTKKAGNTEEYGVIFENGQYEWMPVDYIDKYICETGIEIKELKNYTFTSVISLIDDYKSGVFKFEQ